MCNRNRYMNSEKTQSCKRFGRSLHQYDFSKSAGAYMYMHIQIYVYTYIHILICN